MIKKLIVIALFILISSVSLQSCGRTKYIDCIQNSKYHIEVDDEGSHIAKAQLFEMPDKGMPQKPIKCKDKQ